MADTLRIDELRRRVDDDPASIAFAQLAEEYRRIGRLADAVSVSRAGLNHHPGYVSARITLGRALLELGQHDDALLEIDAAVNAAPENLAARRAREEIRERCGYRDEHTATGQAVGRLETWLAAILADRAVRR